MTVIINGQPKEVADHALVTDLLEALGLKPERVAIELNRKIVRRTDWGSTSLSEGDKVEIVHFVGGGITDSLSHKLINVI